MSQDLGGWPPEDGYAQGQTEAGGLPPSQPGGYSTQGQPGGYPPQSQPGGYAPQPAGYGQPSGGYGPSGAYGAQAGYPPQGYQQGVPGGYLPAGPGYGVPPGGPPPKKSPAMIIGIVAAAVVLLAAVGGIVLVLTRGGETAQPGSTITPGTPTSEPTAQPTTGSPSAQPTATQPSAEPTEQPGGNAIDLGNGVSLTLADGYEVQNTGSGFARLSNGEQLFLGQVISADSTTNPGQLCDAWHRKVAEGQANGKFADPKTADLNNKKLSGATCAGSFTASNGSGSQDIFVFSLVSVRTDGVTVVGTEYFMEDADSDQLNRDFTVMVNSMLSGQAAG